MKKPLWFKAKNYGWGWYPSSWQGWIIVVIYILTILWNFYRLDEYSHSNSDIIRPFVIQTFLITILLIYICIKTGEKPGWSWGKQKIISKNK